MDDQFLPTEIVEDQPVAGFATAVEQSSAVDEADLAVRLKTVGQRLGSGLPGDQGAAGDLLRRLITRVRGRRLKQDHGEHPFRVEWLCSHVPPGGSSRLQLTKSVSESAGIKLSVVGAGLGDGWSFKANLHEDFLDRSRCMAVVETFTVHIRSYGFDDDHSDLEYRCDVIGRVGTGIREMTRCPRCLPSSEPERFMARKAGPAIDLSADSVGKKVSETIIVAGTSENDLNMSVPVVGDLGISGGLTYKREVSFTCKVDYAFAPGRIYQPMRHFQYPDLPFWRVS